MSGSRNVNELPVIGTVNNADKIYIAQSPFGTGNDAATTYSSLLNPTLKRIGNLSDLQDASSSQNNLSINSNIIITGASVLDVSAFGSRLVITSIGGYQITLPAANISTYGFIDVSFQAPYATPYPLVNNFVILYNPSGSFNGVVNTLILGAGDSLRLVSDGTNYWTTNVWLKPVDFLVKLTASESPVLPASTDFLVPYNNVIRNVGNGYDASSYRFFLPVPGLYEFYHCTSLATGTSGANGQYKVEIQDNFATPIEITSQQVNMGADPANSPSIYNKINFLLTSTLNTSFAIEAFQNNIIDMPFDTGASYFGGRRIDLF